MVKEIAESDLLKKDGLMMVRHQVGQKPVDSASGRTVTGESATNVFVGVLKKVIGYSNITLDEALATLDGVDGPYKSGVLKAIKTLQEKEKKKKK